MTFVEQLTPLAQAADAAVASAAKAQADLVAAQQTLATQQAQIDSLRKQLAISNPPAIDVGTTYIPPGDIYALLKDLARQDGLTIDLTPDGVYSGSQTLAVMGQRVNLRGNNATLNLTAGTGISWQGNDGELSGLNPAGGALFWRAGGKGLQPGLNLYVHDCHGADGLHAFGVIDSGADGVHVARCTGHTVKAFLFICADNGLIEDVVCLGSDDEHDIRVSKADDGHVPSGLTIKGGQYSSASPKSPKEAIALRDALNVTMTGVTMYGPLDLGQKAGTGNVSVAMDGCVFAYNLVPGGATWAQVTINVGVDARETNCVHVITNPAQQPLSLMAGSTLYRSGIRIQRPAGTSIKQFVSLVGGATADKVTGVNDTQTVDAA